MIKFFIFFSISYLILSLILRYFIKVSILKPFGYPKLVYIVDFFFISFLIANVVIRQGYSFDFLKSYQKSGYIFIGITWVFFLTYLANIFFTTSKGQNSSRRQFLRKTIGGVGALGAGALAYKGYKNAFEPLVITESIPLPQNYESLSGIKIVQISDLHLGPTLKKDFAIDTVNTTNGLNPDLIFITGDIADGKALEIKDMVEPLRDLKAKFGVYYVVGNHEYYWGVQGWIDTIKALGINVLVDEHSVIDINGTQVTIAGITDKTAPRFKLNHSFDPKVALKNAPDQSYKILLAHRPKACYQAEGLGVNLQLSGHTHGGQAFPWNLAVGLVQPYLKGLYTHKEAYLYVNRGTGFWGPPNRLLNQGEVSLLTLVKKTDTKES